MKDKENKAVKQRNEEEGMVSKTIMFRRNQIKAFDMLTERFGEAGVLLSVSALVRLAVDFGLQEATEGFSELIHDDKWSPEKFFRGEK